MTYKQPQILYVDDDTDSCEMMSKWLPFTCGNCMVTTVSNGKEAINAISEKEFDLYVFDNLLPDASGVELCTAVRQQDPETPIVIYSAMSKFSDRDAATHAGANSYLVKPNDLELLSEVVRNLLDRGTGAIDRPIKHRVRPGSIL